MQILLDNFIIDNGGDTMSFNGEVVFHKSFGIGKILELDNSYVTIIFDNNLERKFSYPDAFGKYLTCKNRELLNQVRQDKYALLEKLEADRVAKIKNMENERLIKDKKKVN